VWGKGEGGGGGGGGPEEPQRHEPLTWNSCWSTARPSPPPPPPHLLL